MVIYGFTMAALGQADVYALRFLFSVMRAYYGYGVCLSTDRERERTVY
jgi:hypothetical protein